MLVVDPPTATIELVDGVGPQIDFAAKVGNAEVSAQWRVDLSSIAAIDGSGLAIATGDVAGEVKVTALYNNATADATLTVRIKRTINPENIPQSEIDLLKNPTGGQDAAITWAYPYDKTVFPRGLTAPELMWNGGGAGDKYYISIKAPFAEFDVFGSADPPSRAPLDPVLWTQLSESGVGGNVDVVMNRLPAGAAAANSVIDHDWKIAPGSLRGTVYYWSNNLGRVLRIKPGAGVPEDFLAAAGETGCSTCHTVSADGSTLVLGGDINVSTFDLLTNTMTMSLGSVGKPVRNWAMPAVSPDGTVVVENNAPLPGPPGGSDAMWDAKTGVKLANTGLDGVFLDMPAFSPEGSKLAFVDHATHSLGVYGYDAVNKRVTGGPTNLVDPGADPNLNLIAFPNMSPDGKWIVYHRGNYPNSLDTRNGPGFLYLASSDNPGVEMRLENANGDGYPFAAGDRDRTHDYEPTFAPLPAGGYAWVVFTSRRTYGNRLVAGPTATKQLWVAAIDLSPVAGQDPSHPAFHVAGQALDTLNMRGFWALEPCKQDGQVCETGSQCCNGNCDDGICQVPDPNGCVDTGNACMQAGDCCDPGATCVNGFCELQVPS